MVAISLSISPEGLKLIASHRECGSRLLAGLRSALSQGLTETEATIQADYLRGGDVHTPRDGQSPLAVRSGGLMGSIHSGMESGDLAGWVGSTGPASKYGSVLLDGGETTITPKSAKHLWVPIADNLTKGGNTRMSPSAAMDQTDANGKRLLSIFRSKAGNLVAFLRDPAGGKYKRGRNAGRARGKLLFVLLDSVTIKGTDALRKAFEDKRPRLLQLLQGAADQALSPGGGS